MKNKVIRIGVAGLGFGAAVHVPAFQSLPGVKVVALCGKNYIKVQKKARSLSVPRFYNSLSEFFKHDMDAVSIALPPKENARACSMAFRADIPVLLEKPVAGSFSGAQKLLRQGRHKLCCVDFQFPELEAFKRIKKMIESRVYGRVLHASLLWELESYAHKAKKNSWKTDARTNGGVLSLLGSHFLYNAEWLFGPVARLSSRLGTCASRVDGKTLKNRAEDFFTSQCEFKNGIFLIAFISNATREGLGHRFEIAFEKAVAVLYNPPGDYMSGFRLSVRKNGEEKVIFHDRRESGVDGRIKPFRSLARRFIAAVRKGDYQIHPSLKDGVRIQQLMEAVRTSSNQSQWISI